MVFYLRNHLKKYYISCTNDTQKEGYYNLTSNYVILKKNCPKFKKNIKTEQFNPFFYTTVCKGVSYIYIYIYILRQMYEIADFMKSATLLPNT
jgi:hypothetical protein